MYVSDYGFEEVVDEKPSSIVLFVLSIPGSSRGGGKKASHYNRSRVILEEVLDARAIPQTPSRF